MTEGGLMNVREASELLTIHPNTVRQYAQAGVIPALKMGPRWRFRRQSLLAWLDAQERQSEHRRVLVVEDEEEVSDVVRLTLEDVGYRVTIAGTGVDAVAMLDTELPDLVLLDLRLPGMSGVDVLRAVRERSPDTQVIIITGYPDSDLVQRALRVSPVMMLAKPVHPETLLGAVATVMGTVR